MTDDFQLKNVMIVAGVIGGITIVIGCIGVYMNLFV